MDNIKSFIEKGLETPTSFSDIEKYNHNGIPPNKYGWFGATSLPTMMDIHVPLSLFQEHIEYLLSTIEGLRYYWDPAKCIWVIEYGTVPLEYNKTDKEIQQILKGKAVALEASNVAFEKFPHLIEYEDNWYINDEPDNDIMYNNKPSMWCKMELRIYNDTHKDCLFIHLNRQTGDCNTSWVVWKQIYHYFNQNKLFLSRASYINFTEGIEFDSENPIIHYICDCMIKRELCTYLQYE